VRTVVEECWADAAGVERMAGLVADGYVHHTTFGDWSFEQFRAGLEWVDGQIGERTYHVRWQGVRRADGTAVDGRGAYHCRIAAGRILGDWDVFFPTG
jgi:hypothetical protein